MYLPTITREGKTLLIETDHITGIQLMQPLNLGGGKVCYFVIISYDNDSKEQMVITEDTWKW